MLQFPFAEILRSANVVPGDLDNTYRSLELMGQVINKIILQLEHPAIDLQVPEQKVRHQDQKAIDNTHHHGNGSEYVDHLSGHMLPGRSEIKFIISKRTLKLGRTKV